MFNALKKNNAWQGLAGKKGYAASITVAIWLALKLIFMAQLELTAHGTVWVQKN